MAKFEVHTQFETDEPGEIGQEVKKFSNLKAAMVFADEEVLWESTLKCEVINGETGEVVDILDGSFNYARD